MIRATVAIVAILLGTSAHILVSGDDVTRPPTAERGSIALTHVTLIDGTGAAPRDDMTVLISGDRIVDVFRTGEKPIPSAADVLDLTGRYVIPGLINTHFHLPMLGLSVDSVMTGLDRMLHAGVTTIREVNGDTRLTAAVVRAGLLDGRALPDIHYSVRIAGPSFYENGAGALAWVGHEAGAAPWAQAVTAETDLVRAVARAAGTGATALKLYADLDVGLVRDIVTEAHRQGLRTWAHGTVFPANALELVQAGIDGLSHVCFIFWGMEGDVASRMQDRRPFDPAAVDLAGPVYQQLFREMADRGIVFDVTAASASRNPGAAAAGCTSDLLRATLHAVRDAGVRMSTGTDFSTAEGEPDPTLFTEIEFLVDAGVLPPLGAITAATLNGARAIGIDNDYGSIEPGKVADLVVLSGDPVADIAALRKIEAVVKAGVVHERSAYDRRR